MRIVALLLFAALALACGDDSPVAPTPVSTPASHVSVAQEPVVPVPYPYPVPPSVNPMPPGAVEKEPTWPEKPELRHPTVPSRP